MNTSSKANGTTNTDIEPQFYTIPQLATLLGIPRGTCTRIVRRGEIASVIVGGHILVPRTAVEELKENATGTNRDHLHFGKLLAPDIAKIRELLPAIENLLNGMTRTHACPGCGEPFYAVTKRAVYCSNACRMKVDRIRKRLFIPNQTEDSDNATINSDSHGS